MVVALISTIIGFVIWLLCLIGCIKLASQKNRSVALFVIFSIFLPIPAIIVAALIKPLPGNN